MDENYQTRSEENGINFYSTITAALSAAKQDLTVWKISFTSESGERIRLIKDKHGTFFISQLMDEVDTIISLGDYPY